MFSSENFLLLIKSGQCSLFCKIIYHGKPALEGFRFKDDCLRKGIWKDGKLVEGEKFFTNGTAEKGYFANDLLYYGERRTKKCIEKGYFSKGIFTKGTTYFSNNSKFEGSHNIKTNKRVGKFFGVDGQLKLYGTWFLKDNIKYFEGIEHCNNGCQKYKVLIKFNKNKPCEYLSKMNLRKRKRKN